MKASTADVAGLEDPESVPIPMTRAKSDPVDFPPDSSVGSRPSTELFARPSRARRVVIRFLGLAALGGVVYGAVIIGRTPRAREEIATWGTMGNPKLASTAARGVRSIAEAVRSIGK